MKAVLGYPELRRRILDSLREDGPWSAWELSVILQLHNRYMVSDIIELLHSEGWVYRTRVLSKDPVGNRATYRYSTY